MQNIVTVSLRRAVAEIGLQKLSNALNAASCSNLGFLFCAVLEESLRHAIPGMMCLVRPNKAASLMETTSNQTTEGAFEHPADQTTAGSWEHAETEQPGASVVKDETEAPTQATLTVDTPTPEQPTPNPVQDSKEGVPASQPPTPVEPQATQPGSADKPNPPHTPQGTRTDMGTMFLTACRLAGHDPLLKHELFEWDHYDDANENTIPENLTWAGKDQGVALPFEVIHGKSVIEIQSKAAPLDLWNKDYAEMKLCDGPTVDLAHTSVCTIAYESGESPHVALALTEFKNRYGKAARADEVVVLKTDSLKDLKNQLVNADGSSRIPASKGSKTTVFFSTHSDPAGSSRILRLNADAMLLILENTDWDIRIASRCTLLARLISQGMIPSKYHKRLSLGFIISSYDEGAPDAMEKNASSVKLRFRALRWLQTEGIRTFVILYGCLPRPDWDGFLTKMGKEVDFDKCELVYGRALVVPSKVRVNIIQALENAGLDASDLRAVFTGKDAKQYIEDNAQAFHSTLFDHFGNKVRFGHEPDSNSISYWAAARDKGACPFGITARKRLLTAGGNSSPCEVVPELTEADIAYLAEREQTVRTGKEALIRMAYALSDIRNYEGGKLWRANFPTYDDYCQAEYSFGETQGNRWADVGDFLKLVELSEGKNIEEITNLRLPESEGQIRKMLKAIPRENQVEAWKYIVGKHDFATPLTGDVAVDLGREYARSKNLTLKPTVHSLAPDKKADLLSVFKSFKSKADKMPHSEQVAVQMKAIQTWIENQNLDNRPKAI